MAIVYLIVGELRRRIPQDGTNPFPGVQEYLKTEWIKRGDWNRSQYNKRAREAAAWAIDFLILFLEKQPERELTPTLTDERIDRLLSAFLTQSKKKMREQDPDRQDMIERENRTAAMLMQKGIARCFQRVDEGYKNIVQDQAAGVLGALYYAATKGQPRLLGHPLYNYSFAPERYQANQGEPKRR